MPIPKPSPGRGGRAPAAVSLLNLIIPSTAKLVSSQPLTRRPSPRSKCGQRARAPHDAVDVTAGEPAAQQLAPEAAQPRSVVPVLSNNRRRLPPPLIAANRLP